MSDTATEPRPAKLFLGDTREARWVALIAVVATILVHLAVILVVPERLMSFGSGAKTTPDAAAAIYEISLVEPAEAHYVEANPDAPENEPDRTDQYSFRNQQAADESPLADASNQPKVEGEDDNSQKILQGSLQQMAPVEAGVYTPVDRPGEGEGEAGGKLGKPSEVALPMPSPVLPAPDFIQQDPVTEEGPGSRSEIVANAPELTEVPDSELPIDVYRPESTPEATQVVGDGAGGSSEVKAQPRPRPRLAPELITGPLMRSQGSASRRGQLQLDATFSEFGEYEQQFYAAVQTGWYQEIEFFQPIDTATRAIIQFTLHADGRVTDVKAVQSTASKVATFICETAISKRSPFRPWTKEMVQVFGQERTLNVAFYYR